MDKLSIIYLIFVIFFVLVLIFYYVYIIKNKMIEEINKLEKLSKSLKNDLDNYLKCYLEYINLRKKYINKVLYDEIILEIDKFININNINEYVIEYKMVDALLVCFDNELKDSKKNLKKYDTILLEKQNTIIKHIRDYNKSVLTLESYLNSFLTVIVAKVYKFKHYPYFIFKNNK